MKRKWNFLFCDDPKLFCTVPYKWLVDSCILPHDTKNKRKTNNLFLILCTSYKYCCSLIITVGMTWQVWTIQICGKHGVILRQLNQLNNIDNISRLFFECCVEALQCYFTMSDLTVFFKPLWDDHLRDCGKIVGRGKLVIRERYGLFFFFRWSERLILRGVVFPAM